MLDDEYEVMYRLENHHWWFKAKQRYVEIILNRHMTERGGKILDVGCGTGGMIGLLQKYGQVFGLDRHQAACDFFRQKSSFPLIRGDANRLPFKKGSFHLITLFDVLYHQHILEDKMVLRQIHELLDSGGMILITDSAFDFLKSTHDIAVMARHRYTLKELRAKMESADFTIKKSTYLYFLIFPLVVLSRLFRKTTRVFFKPVIRSDLKKTNPILNQFLTGLLSWEGSWLNRFSLPFGSSLLILGKRG